MKNLEKEIERSKYIYDLKDNWNDEGSNGYSKETWEKTIQFIRNWSKWLNDNNIEVEAPNIYHGYESGIDILWRPKAFAILIALNKEVTKGSYYADIDGVNKCGEFDIVNCVTDFSKLPYSKL